jgi:hypothetical protein
MWIFVGLFVVLAAATPFATRSLSRSVDPPRTLTALTELLSQEAPSLYVVPLREDYPEAGIYICVQSQPREQLMRLGRCSEFAGTWQGVVFCERVGNFSVVEEHEIQGWSEHGMQVGPLLFFGDPNLLRRIRTVISGEHHA